MLEIFLIVLMLTGIIVFSIQPTDKETNDSTTVIKHSATKIAQIKDATSLRLAYASETTKK
ncbi:hypothetical protein ACLI1A_02690 [Flavobacterium sp. RHBU_3]|uniref:hypothetical protein n=1 Tax=Flavobacterium sp. RHBU_3 TaxID=3391184 RepID=UPI003984A4A1